MEGCIFCKIIEKKIKADIVFENKDVIVFKDIKPSAPVHCLVVPKKHIQSIAHLEHGHKEVLAEIIYAAKDVAKNLGLKGYKLVFNVGKEGGQVVDHLHLHLLGGWTRKEDIDKMPHPSIDK